MGKWRECKSCDNSNDGDNIYLCKEDNHLFCEECGDWTPNIAGNDNCICPICHSTSDVRILGEIDSDAYDYDEKCENCGNVDDDDMLYKCKEDELLFCQECGDYAYNIHGNDNCICPVCHSTSDVKILGKIGGEERNEREEEEEDDDDDDDDNDTDNNDDHDSNDDDEEKDSSSSSNSSGGCFITTACIQSKGLPDDCYELMILRNFRDTYMQNLTTGKADIDFYYKIAPKIVDKINSRLDKRQIWNNVYQRLVISIKLIENNKLDAAYSSYKILFNELIHL